MKTINLGLIGYGVVGQGVAKILNARKSYFRDKYNCEFTIKTLCDRSYTKKDTSKLTKTHLTKKFEEVLNDPDIDIVIELIGGMNPAKDIVQTALKNNKHVITANKELIANSGKELFSLARKQNTYLYYESSVGAGIPIIKSITEGIVGNKFHSIYGIINGTCNYILDEMTTNDMSFEEALKLAQQKGYAESDPTLDINGMDATHKLAILINLTFGKFIKVNDIYTEGINKITHVDIQNAEKLGLVIKLLAIAKKTEEGIEARVHPTLISKDHPLASINSILNAIYLGTKPLGNILLSGEGAGQYAAASGVVSDLVNIASKGPDSKILANIPTEASGLKICKIDEAHSRYYIRVMATDKPGVLSKITGELGKAGIGINSVTQHAHDKTSSVPVIMLTDYTTEKQLRKALAKINQLPTVKSKAIAIRMEKL